MLDRTAGCLMQKPKALLMKSTVALLLLFFGSTGIHAQDGNETLSLTTSSKSVTLDLDSLDPEQLKIAAEGGSAEAQYRLGMLYRMGSDKLKFRKNRTQAAVWLRKAAEQGFFEADLELAKIRMTRYTQAEPENWEKVIAHWQKEANAGSHEAQANLGFCFAEGIGVEPDGAQSVRWCTMAVESDPSNHFPMFTLATLYRDGKLVPRNPSLAFEWMQKAANTGYGWAQLRLAEMHAEGVGTEQDFASAVKWAEMAQASGVGKEAKEATERYAGLAKRPKTTKFDIFVGGESVTVTRIGSGSVGVIFFGHTGVAEMNKYLLDNFEWLEDLATKECTFFLWEYPKSAPFDQIPATLKSYRDGNLSVRIQFPGVANSVISQIQSKSGLKTFLIVGNSLGAGIVLQDYVMLVQNTSLNFLLISPTEAFMPEPTKIAPLERTTLLAVKGYKRGKKGDERYSTDSWLRGEEHWQWVTANRDDTLGDLITASRASEPEIVRELADGSTYSITIPTDFTFGHKTIGNEINAELLNKLIRVQLGLADKAVLAEAPKQTDTKQ